MDNPVANINTKEDLLTIIDKVAISGIPLEIKRKGKRLLIVPVKHSNKLESLDPHPDFIAGDPNALVHLDWSSEWKLDQ